MPLIFVGVISDIYVCPEASAIPSPALFIIFPTRNCGLAEAVNTIDTPMIDNTPAMSIVHRRPNRSETGPEAQAPSAVVSWGMAFHNDCQYAGMMYSPFSRTPNCLL